MDIRAAQQKLRPISAAAAVLLGLARLGPPPRSNGPRNSARL
jgi:hypothetical protein